MTSNTTNPLLRLGGTLPIFYLPSAAGGQSGPASTRSKYNLVLTFLPNVPESAAYLQGMAQLYPEILRNDARVIAVLGADIHATQQTAQALELPFTMLSDENGATAARVLGEGNHAGLIATDRYGIIYCMEAASDLSNLPAPSTILEWLEYIEIQCPECTDGADQRWLAD